QRRPAALRPTSLRASLQWPPARARFLVADDVRQRAAPVREPAAALRARRPQPRAAAGSRRLADAVPPARAAAARPGCLAAGARGPVRRRAPAVRPAPVRPGGRLGPARHSLRGLPLVGAAQSVRPLV